MKTKGIQMGPNNIGRIYFATGRAWPVGCRSFLPWPYLAPARLGVAGAGSGGVLSGWAWLVPN